MSRLLIILAVLGLILVAASGAPAADEPATSDTAATAPADDPSAEVGEIMAGVEGLVTQLAVAQELGPQEVEALRKSLATLYSQLEGLSATLASLKVGPPLDLTQWRPYEDASVDLEPADAKFSGWNIDSAIDLGWGDYGEVTLDIQNSAYRAVWTIRKTYRGEVKATVEAGPEGNVLLTIMDSDGTREFRIENGGVGPISIREPEAGTAPGIESATADANGTNSGEAETGPASPDPPWTAEYRAAVAAGQLEDAPTMEWFINQTKTRNYETDALRDLGEAVLGLNGQPKWDEPLGVMAYYVNDERKEMHIPDPRTYPEGFTHVINKMYILTLSEQVCTVEIY